MTLFHLAALASVLGGCCHCPSQLYLRDAGSGLLYGPIAAGGGELDLGGRFLYVTKPFPGELETIEQAKAIAMDVEFSDADITAIARLLDSKQGHLDASSRIPVSLYVHESWFRAGPDGDESPTELPRVTMVMQGSFHDVLKGLAARVPYYFYVVLRHRNVRLVLVQLQKSGVYGWPACEAHYRLLYGTGDVAQHPLLDP